MYILNNLIIQVRLRRRFKARAVACACAIFSQTAVAQLPTGGAIVQGAGSISTNGATMTVLQTTDRMAANWQSFSVGQGSSVNFVQPSVHSVALNRVLGSDVSLIQGAINANGKVFLVNPNGILFTPTAQVDVGGLVASTLSISAADFMTGNYRFEGASTSAITNQGRITASQGGTIALVAARIINDGALTAHGGHVLLGAGSRVTLDLGGPVKLQVANDALETLIENGGAIRADGGKIYLTSQAAASLTSSVINNTGVIEANALATGERGEVILFAHGGQMNLGGAIHARGGFVETSGKYFSVQPGASVAADQWLIDPVNVTIDNTLASSIQTALGTGDVTITTTGSCTGVTCSGAGSDGNITVSSAVAWSSNQTLTLTADNNIAVNANLTHTGTSAGGIRFLYGQASPDGGASTYAGTGTVTSPSIQWRKGSDSAGLRYAIVDGNYFLGGGFIEVGICGPSSTACSSGGLGKFGTSNKPSLFFGRQTGSGIGMVGDADGFGTGADLRIDYFLPGTPAEQFTVGYTGQNGLKNFASVANSGTVGNFSVSSDNTVSITYSAVAESKLKVDQAISLKVSNAFFKNAVTLSNVSGSSLTDVVFVRSFDPDNTRDIGGAFSNIQKIENTLAAGDSANVVSATSQAGDAYATASGGNTAKIIYYSTEPATQVGYGSSFFQGDDISAMRAAADALSKNSSQTADQGIGILYKPGTIAAGASTSFSYLTSLDNRDISTILRDLGAASGVSTTTIPRTSTPLTAAIARASQQPNEVFRGASDRGVRIDIGAAGRPPLQVTLPQANALPVVDLSGGLAFVELSGAPSGTTTASGQIVIPAMDTPPPGITGVDPLGFMRVFVTRGGIKTPQEAASDAAAENARRAESLRR